MYYKYYKIGIMYLINFIKIIHILPTNNFMVLEPTNHAADLILRLTGGIKGLRNGLNLGCIIYL